MKLYNKSYSLATGKESEQLSVYEIRVDYDEHKAGNPYNTSFCVDVVSRHFAGLAYFEYSIEHFIAFVRDLRDFYDFKINTVELNNDFSYGSEVKFLLFKTGQVEVSGKLYGGISGEQSLVFKFISDQTAFKAFSSALYDDFIVNNDFL